MGGRHVGEHDRGQLRGGATDADAVDGEPGDQPQRLRAADGDGDPDEPDRLEHQATEDGGLRAVARRDRLHEREAQKRADRDGQKHEAGLDRGQSLARLQLERQQEQQAELAHADDQQREAPERERPDAGEGGVEDHRQRAPDLRALDERERGEQHSGLDQRELGALSDRERRGLELFKAYGCVTCHQGVNVGGNMFQQFGVFPGVDVQSAGGDLGRYHVTHVARDRGVFRVPSLRNVAVTAPYFHDGRAPTLELAVDTMARVQLGRTLGADEIELIVEFLRTLTGEYRGRSIVAGPPVDR